MFPARAARSSTTLLLTPRANFTWHEFNGQHAFLRDEGPRYDPELAIICYTMAIDLLRRKLGEGDLPVLADAGKAESRPDAQALPLAASPARTSVVQLPTQPAHTLPSSSSS